MLASDFDFRRDFRSIRTIALITNPSKLTVELPRGYGWEPQSAPIRNRAESDDWPNDDVVAGHVFECKRPSLHSESQSQKGDRMNHGRLEPLERDIVIKIILLPPAMPPAPTLRPRILSIRIPRRPTATTGTATSTRGSST